MRLVQNLLVPEEYNMGDYKVIVDFDKCTGCGTCVDECPQEVYDDPVDGKVVVAREDDCVGCEACVPECPEEAIKIE